MIHPYVFIGLPESEKPSSKKVIDTICKYFDLDYAVVISNNRKANIVMCRSFIWLFLKNKKVSYSNVNAIMGTGHNHTTIMHGLNKLRGYIETDENYAKLYRTLSDTLQIYPISDFKVYSLTEKRKVVQIPQPKEIEPKKVKRIEIPKSRYDMPHGGWGKMR